MSLVDTVWLEKNINDVKIIDCSWHMPQTNRDGYEEYKKKHIPNTIFFDLDENSNRKSDLPHMLVDLVNWEKIVSNMGINNSDKIIMKSYGKTYEGRSLEYLIISSKKNISRLENIRKNNLLS